MTLVGETGRRTPYEKTAGTHATEDAPRATCDCSMGWAGRRCLTMPAQCDADANFGMSGHLAQPQGHAPEVVVDCHREMTQKVHPQQATIGIVTG